MRWSARRHRCPRSVRSCSRAPTECARRRATRGSGRRRERRGPPPRRLPRMKPERRPCRRRQARRRPSRRPRHSTTNPLRPRRPTAHRSRHHPPRHPTLLRASDHPPTRCPPRPPSTKGARYRPGACCREASASRKCSGRTPTRWTMPPRHGPRARTLSTRSALAPPGHSAATQSALTNQLMSVGAAVVSAVGFIVTVNRRSPRERTGGMTILNAPVVPVSKNTRS